MKLLNEILGTKYPIIQGGMANIATGEFAAACSNAGALGLIGSGGVGRRIRHFVIVGCPRPVLPGGGQSLPNVRQTAPVFPAARRPCHSLPFHVPGS